MNGALPLQQEAARPILFQQISLREVALKNRIVVSPMSMYSARNGFVDDFHLVHLGRFALGGAGMVMLEATAVSAQGRITHGCNGIWQDDHVPHLKRIADFLAGAGAVPAIQLGHSGPKGSAQRPWHGNGPLGPEDALERGEKPWPLIAASAAGFDDGWVVPAAATEADLESLLVDYRHATRRALQAGFRMVELHCAHGYLLHSFLSPLTNHRTDTYGGSLENRMRFPLQVAAAVRAEWPQELPMSVRISAVDGIDIGWSIEDSVEFCKRLRALGIDAIACSSGGMKLPRGKALVSRAPGFQVPFAARVRKEAGIATLAVGLIRDPEHAERVLAEGEADLIALGRELLANPNWPAQAALAMLEDAGWQEWPEQFGWWLERRERHLRPKDR